MNRDLPEYMIETYNTANRGWSRKMASQQKHFLQDNEFVWMPVLKVWIPRSCSSLCNNQNRPGSPKRKKNKNPHQSSLSTTALQFDDELCMKKPRTEDFTCPICLCSLSNAHSVLVRFCMHRFCHDCISKWSLVQRKCPLCKGEFDGWFYDIQSPGRYQETLLQPLQERPGFCSGDGGQMPATQRTLQRARNAIVENQRRHQHIQRRRKFGYSRFVPNAEKRRIEEEKEAERVLRWRASIYRNGLRAIPTRLQRKVKAQSVIDLNERLRIERRLEPWVCRELKAIVGEDDPLILLHLVTSLWLSRLLKLENEQNGVHAVNEDEYINQLIPFLGDKAALFWHELSCFSESPFSMSTYDSVVEYRRHSYHNIRH